METTSETYLIERADGRTSTHETYQEACDAIYAEYADAEIGHAGDISEGGDRTLCWADATSAQDDDGRHAVATIREVRS